MAASVALGMLAGLAASRILPLTQEFFGNVGLWILIGGAIGFLIDLLFVTPIRLWQEAERQLTEVRNKPPAGMHIEHIDTQVNIQVAAGGSLQYSASSNTVIVGQDQEGILVPRGTIFQRDTFDHLSFNDEAVAVVISGTVSTGIAFVPPELLKPPSEPTEPDQSSSSDAISSHDQT
jgi:hypothetical protein